MPDLIHEPKGGMRPKCGGATGMMAHGFRRANCPDCLGAPTPEPPKAEPPGHWKSEATRLNAKVKNQQAELAALNAKLAEWKAVASRPEVMELRALLSSAEQMALDLAAERGRLQAELEEAKEDAAIARESIRTGTLQAAQWAREEALREAAGVADKVRANYLALDFNAAGHFLEWSKSAAFVAESILALLDTPNSSANSTQNAYSCPSCPCSPGTRHYRNCCDGPGCACPGRGV